MLGFAEFQRWDMTLKIFGKAPLWRGKTASIQQTHENREFLTFATFPFQWERAVMARYVQQESVNVDRRSSRVMRLSLKEATVRVFQRGGIAMATTTVATVATSKDAVSVKL